VDALDLLLHPVRLRIVHAMAGRRVRTTAELRARLPDVSQATVYRQVSLLVEGGLLEVASETRVRGAVERRFRLSHPRPAIGQGRAASMSIEAHRSGFLAAIGALVAEFNAYLDRKHADPNSDSVGYRQLPLWLNSEEVAELVREETRIINSMAGNEPRQDRRLYLLSPILFPIDERPESGSGVGADQRT
jgi:DNA-binding transcriptional ArsR family regulator